MKSKIKASSRRIIDPTPLEIERARDIISASWSKKERWRRAGKKPVFTVPFVRGVKERDSPGNIDNDGPSGESE
ncbi:MAG: hypothetical protein Q7S57_04140 [bacterium]|nr:hypothetical protein [bacterium]